MVYNLNKAYFSYSIYDLSKKIIFFSVIFLHKIIQVFLFLGENKAFIQKCFYIVKEKSLFGKLSLPYYFLF